MLWPDLKKIIFDFMCMGIFPACMPVDYMPVWCSLSLERGHRIPLKLESLGMELRSATRAASVLQR